MKLKVKRLNTDAVVPDYAKAGDAGLDLTASDDGANMIGEDGYMYREYGTGLAVEIPEGFVGLIFPRSSISKTSLTLANSVGVIDSGYRGEIKFRFRMDVAPMLVAPDKVKQAAVYKKGDRIGQLIVMPYPVIEVECWDGDLSSSERGTGGFGSTGQ